MLSSADKEQFGTINRSQIAGKAARRNQAICGKEPKKVKFSFNIELIWDWKADTENEWRPNKGHKSIEEINNTKIRREAERVRGGVEKNIGESVWSKEKNTNTTKRYLLIWQYNNCPNYLNLATILIWY